MNVDADALSRIPWENCETELLDKDTVKAIMAGLTVEVPYLETHYCNPHQSHDPIPVIMKDLHIPKDDPPDWKFLQSQDLDVARIIELVKNKKINHQKVLPTDSPMFKLMMRKRGQFVIREGLLYRKTKTSTNQTNTMQFVLPREQITKVLKSCHDDMGHQGIFRT